MSQPDALDLFKVHGTLTVRELANLLGRSYHVASHYVRRLRGKGYLDMNLIAGKVRYCLR